MNDNNFFTAQFKEENCLFVLFHFPSKDGCYYHMIISDDKGDIYLTDNVKNGFWYKYGFSKFFKYDIKLLSFDGEKPELIDQKIFDIRNHKFLINLKSSNEQEIKIWTDYLKFIETTLSTQFDYVINGDLPEPDKILDTIEISRFQYDAYIKSSDKPLTDDYSSLTIIKTLFDIL